MSDGTPPLVLASGSPRRAELLRRLGLDFQIVPADIDESALEGEAPADLADRLARDKAEAVARDRPDAVVIGSDTIVVVDGDVLGKPTDQDDAFRMLRRLSGRQHVVITGVAIAHAGETASSCEAVDVTFRDLSETVCREYVQTGEPMDKAGSYGIQGFGSAIVDRIDGDYFAVMGLPISRLLDLFDQHGLRYAFRAGLVRRND